MACALAHKACRDGYSAFYVRATTLFRDLALARADDSLRNLLLVSRIFLELNGPPPGVWPPAWPRMDPNRGRSMRSACFMDATKWLAGNEALVQETGNFYSHAANVLLPPMADLVYSPMKRNGASARD